VINVQTPGVASQRRQGVVHALSQQRPSAQKPLAHWRGAPQLAPLVSCGTHWLFWQKVVAAQWSSLTQAVRQVSPRQP
jgi:hypothetical protein